MVLRLFYCNHLKNFGDALNSWLWPQLLPGFFDADNTTLFLGIGTLLSNLVPAAPHKLVFGSGAGYGAFPTMDESWSVYCVRGPLTAKALGLPRKAAITDPAILVRSVLKPQSIDGDVSYMPHYLNTHRADWSALCRQAGLRYIDPTDTVDHVITAIASSRLLITDALHGAIVADALRVPWVAVRSYPHILEFKWRDWCASLDMVYAPIALPVLWDAYSCGNSLTRLRLRVKAALVRRGIRHRRWSASRPLVSPSHDFDQALHILCDLKSGTHAMLSRDIVMDNATDRLLTTLEYLKHEMATVGKPETVRVFAEGTRALAR
jgi:succinoglycan biosynthesis protein ExoV